MAQVLTSISGLQISAASAGFAPTNSADVSAIASGYQVVSSTATQLYAGTAYVTSVNGDALSAARAGNAANASLATSAWYDGTGRLISALPDSAAVSSIASGYAESAVSGVIDTVSTNSASWGAGASIPITGSAGDVTATYEVEFLSFVRNDTAGEPDIRTASLDTDELYIDYTLDGIDHTSMSLTESMLDFMDSDGDHTVDAHSIDSWNSAVNTVANNSASWGGGVDSATVSAIASGYAESAVSSKLDTTAQVVTATAGDGTYITSINGMEISGQGGGGTPGDYVEKSSYHHSLGSSNTVLGTSTGSMYLINGTGISADLGGAYVQLVNGAKNTAKHNAFINGYGNFASGGGSILGINSKVTGLGLAVGSLNTINGAALTVGNNNTAYGNSMCIGSYNSAAAVGYAFGSGLKIKNYALALGMYNSASDGTHVALVIGDGYVYNDGAWHTANHDLMVVTKDGEITMYSSTADTVGTGIMSSIRAISAAATGGGDVYVSGFGYNNTAISSIEGSALYDKSAHARITTVAGKVTNVSAAVSGTVDLVSTQSANWGGSALALSAGPGVKLAKVGDTLVASTDETVLWENTAGRLLAQGITLSESRLNFEMLRFYMASQIGKSVISYDMPMYGLNRTTAFAIQPSMPFTDIATTGFAINWQIAITATESTMASVQALFWGKTNFGSAASASGTWTQGTNNGGIPAVYKVIGINRTAGV